MSDTTRLAAIAATVVVVAVGGLYLVSLNSSGEPGGPGPTATPTSAATGHLGTITLHGDGCTWDANPGSVEHRSQSPFASGRPPEPLRATLDIVNETDTFANFGMYRVDDGYPWADAAAWILRENEAMHGGPSQPPQDFATQTGSLDAPERGRQTVNVAFWPGVHGVVCSSNEPPPFPGDVYAIYLVGPLEITEP
jgi:hypothetical protein